MSTLLSKHARPTYVGGTCYYNHIIKSIKYGGIKRGVGFLYENEIDCFTKTFKYKWLETIINKLSIAKKIPQNTLEIRRGRS